LSYFALGSRVIDPELVPYRLLSSKIGKIGNKSSQFPVTEVGTLQFDTARYLRGLRETLVRRGPASGSEPFTVYHPVRRTTAEEKRRSPALYHQIRKVSTRNFLPRNGKVMSLLNSVCYEHLMIDARPVDRLVPTRPGNLILVVTIVFRHDPLRESAKGLPI
jgi:hypothetical protein